MIFSWFKRHKINYDIEEIEKVNAKNLLSYFKMIYKNDIDIIVENQ